MGKKLWNSLPVALRDSKLNPFSPERGTLNRFYSVQRQTILLVNEEGGGGGGWALDENGLKEHPGPTKN